MKIREDVGLFPRQELFKGLSATGPVGDLNRVVFFLHLVEKFACVGKVAFEILLSFRSQRGTFEHVTEAMKKTVLVHRRSKTARGILSRSEVDGDDSSSLAVQKAQEIFRRDEVLLLQPSSQFPHKG